MCKTYIFNRGTHRFLSEIWPHKVKILFFCSKIRVPTILDLIMHIRGPHAPPSNILITLILLHRKCHHLVFKISEKEKILWICFWDIRVKVSVKSISASQTSGQIPQINIWKSTGQVHIMFISSLIAPLHIYYTSTFMHLFKE